MWYFQSTSNEQGQKMINHTLRQSFINILSTVKDAKFITHERLDVTWKDIDKKTWSQPEQEIIRTLIESKMLTGEETNTSTDCWKPNYTKLAMTAEGYLFLQRLLTEEEQESLLYKVKQAGVYLLSSAIGAALTLLVQYLSHEFKLN